jgi:hypothetical protein
MTWSVVIEMSPKSPVLLAYSLACRNRKKRKTRVASFARFGSLAPPAAVTAC